VLLKRSFGIGREAFYAGAFEDEEARERILDTCCLFILLEGNQRFFTTSAAASDRSYRGVKALYSYLASVVLAGAKNRKGAEALIMRRRSMRWGSPISFE